MFVELKDASLLALFPRFLETTITSYTHPLAKSSSSSINEPTDALVFPPSLSLTRGVKPVSCHSHNDYWRPRPLYSAVHAGCIGVEADIWLYSDELYVGHTTSTLEPNRTFNHLYVRPLVEILDARNTRRTLKGETPNGVFLEAPHQTLVLLVDFKMDGQETWPFFMDQLNPLREKGYLTYYDGSRRVDGPVTVVGTGNAPFHLIASNSTHRDIFYDAPLARLSEGGGYMESYRPEFGHAFQAVKSVRSPSSASSSPYQNYDFTNSFYASASFMKSIGTCWAWMLSKSQVNTIRSHVRDAHEKGLYVRYWSSPTFPHGFRDRIWRLMIREGVDMLNTDDLVAATTKDWKWKGKWAWIESEGSEAAGEG
ncbi:Altered inheritance of mitochondria protein 6 [Ascosphaera aggregata]|nr:Altered inheritance of mitochondria protein 6 [Ascosphaera aggregata]